MCTYSMGNGNDRPFTAALHELLEYAGFASARKKGYGSKKSGPLAAYSRKLLYLTYKGSKTL